MPPFDALADEGYKAYKFGRHDLAPPGLDYRVLRARLAIELHKFPAEIDEMNFQDAADVIGYLALRNALEQG